MNIRIDAGKLLSFSFAIIAALVCVYIMTTISSYYLGHGRLLGAVWLFDMDGERNLPTLLAVLALLFAAMLLAIIAHVEEVNNSPYRLHWLGLAIMFLFMSIDESWSIHEHFSRPIQLALNTSGPLLFAWVIPYGILVAVIGVTFIKFLLHLPLRTRILFIGAGLTYLSGVIGMELVAGRHLTLYQKDMVYYLYVALEESLELAGTVLFVYALLTYLSKRVDESRVCFRIR